MTTRIIYFFDKLEDSIRGSLSRRPVLYTAIGSVAIVLFWRGVWMTADLFPFLTGPVSIILSVAVLLATGLFVSFFVGDAVIISGMKKEKKIMEKTESEIKSEEIALREIKRDLEEMKTLLRELKK